MSKKNLKSLNYIKSSTLYIGQELKVIKNSNKKTTVMISKSTNNEKTSTHTVSRGESLSIIAKRYNMTVKNLISMNHLKSSNIAVGQKLVISDSFSEMLLVKGGSFQMGSEDGYHDDKPVHSVTVSDFYLGKYEVTQKEWLKLMDSNPSKWKNDDLPVERVSWHDIVEFCNKKSSAEGLTPCYSGWLNSKCDFSANGYRLPTEAEWAFAARGGLRSKGYKYSGSNTIGHVAWFKNNSVKSTHPVGSKAANELGFFDMTGNVREWCNDRYGRYSDEQQANPIGAKLSTFFVVRGSSYNDTVQRCRVPSRVGRGPGIASSSIGFRLAKGATKP